MMYRTKPIKLPHKIGGYDDMNKWHLQYNVTTEVMGYTDGTGKVRVRFHSGNIDSLVRFMDVHFGETFVQDQYTSKMSWYLRNYADPSVLIVPSMLQDAREGQAAIDHDRAVETAIEWLHDAGYRMDDTAADGDKVSETTQTLLMEVMMRAPALTHFGIIKTRDTIRHMELRAYNVLEGMVLAIDEKFWVVKEHRLYPVSESVLIVARRADDGDEEVVRPFVFNYNETVHVIGAVKNANDPDDNDWGTPDN